MRAPNIATLLCISFAALAGLGQAFAATTITAVTGGSAISATNTGGAWTTLTGPALTESAIGAIGTGTIILSAPSGFQFNTAVTVTARVNGSSRSSDNLNNVANAGTIAVTVTASNLTLTITATSANFLYPNKLTWQNIQVRPTAGTPLASGALTRSGTSTLQGLTGSWGTLTEVAGPPTRLTFLTPPGGATAGAVFGTQPVVQSQDQFGNSSTNGLPANSYVRVALSSGTGPLQGTTNVNLGMNGGKGTATFTNLRIDVAGTNKQLTVTSTNGLAGGVSSVFAVSPAAAAKLVLTTPPSTTATAGVPFAQQPVVQIQDAFNNLRTSDTLVATATRSAGAGTLLGTTNIAATGGVATFTNLAHSVATTITLTFTSGTLTSATSGSIVVSPGPCRQFQLLLPGETALPGSPTGKTGSPAGQTAGIGFTARINAADAYWNPAATNIAAVNLASSDPSAAIPGSVALVNGTNSFPVTLAVAGNQTLRAAYATLNGTSAPVAVSASAPAKLLVLMPGESLAPGTPTGRSGTPTAQSAGTAAALTVYAVDTNWNPVTSTHTIAITSSDPNATLPANAALAGGVGTFSVTFKTAGTQSVTATDVSASPLSANTGSATTVNPGALANLQLLLPGETAQPGTPTGKTGTPTAQTAGTAFTVRLNAADASWNLLNTNIGSVSLATSDTNATLPTAVALPNGTNSFAVTLKAAGSQTLRATYASLNSTSAPVAVAASAPARLLVLMPGEVLAPGTSAGRSGTPTPQIAGAVTACKVYATDANWNPVASTDAVAITSSDANALLPANASLSGGIATFNLTFKTAGSQTVTATDVSASPLAANTSSSTAVNSGTFARLQLLLPGETAAPGTIGGKTGTAIPQAAGLAFSARISATDTNWNLVSTNVAAVTLASSDPNATLPASVGLVNGTNAFNVTLKTLGNQTLAATYGALNATSTPVTVSASAPAKLLVLMPGESLAPGTTTGRTGSPIAQTAGIATSLAVYAVDANWDPVASTDTVAITSSDTNAVVPANAALSNGVGTFSVTFRAAGTRTVTATDVSANPLSPNTGSAATVSAAAFSQLQLLLPGEVAAPGTTTGKTGVSTAQTAGTAFNLTVNAADDFWNVVITNHLIGLTCSDANATLPTNAPLSGGTRTFSLTFKTGGSQTATATDLTDASKAAATSPATLVNPGVFTKLQLLVPGETAAPGSVTGKSGAPLAQYTNMAFAVTVNGVDANWNVVNTNDTIHLVSSDAQAVLPTNAPLVAGTRAFNVALRTLGSATLTASNVTHTAITRSVSSTIPVQYAGLLTNTYDFTYTGRTALLADGWSFLARLPDGTTRNTEITNAADGALISYDQTAHPGVLRIPVDTGDLWGSANNTRNSLFHGLSTNWVSVRLDFTFLPTTNYQQAQLALYQDDDNYVEVGHAYSDGVGREAVTLLTEDGGVQSTRSPLPLNHTNLSATHLYLRLDRDLNTDRFTGLYSLDNTNWVTLGLAYQALTNARVCVWAGGSADGLPNCDLRRLQVITSSIPLNPLLIVQPQQLVFNAVAGQPCTNLQQLRVVARRALSPVPYTVASSAPWLSATPVLTATPGYGDIGVNTSGLAAGIYQGTLTCSAPGATSAVASVTLIVNPAVRARAATWRGARAGAMTVWVDDAQPTAFDELTANGFAGTYLLWGRDRITGPTFIPSFATNYYLAGMELGGHTVDHICLGLDEPAVRYEFETNIVAILAYTPEPANQLISFAFPCGLAPIPAQVDAADYYLAVHSYNVNQLEDPSPYNFMFLKSFNSHEHAPYPPADFKPLVQAAVAQGKWFNLVLHTTNNSDGAISFASSQDIWVAPGGTVTKYILQRDRTILTNYQENAGQISFSFYRLPLAASSVRSFETAIGPQDALTFQVDTTGSNAMYGVTLNGSPVASSAKISGGQTFMVFDVPVSTSLQTAVLTPIPNRPPALPSIAAQTVSQFVTLLVTNSATDADLPAQALTYTLTDAPAGAQIGSNGIIQWTPDGTQPPGSYTLTTIVTDNGQPALRATNSFTVSVQQQRYLTLPALAESVLSPGQTLLLTNTATYTRPLNPWTTNTTLFTYTNRSALLADGWSFMAMTPGIGPRNTEITNPAVGAVISYDQAAHPGTLRIPCDLGDLWASVNTSRNALFRSLTSNWTSLWLNLSFAPTMDYQQVHLAVAQDDDDYLQAGFAFNTSLGGQVSTLILETRGNPDHFYTALYGVTNINLRLDQAGISGHVTASYSLDGNTWLTVGAYDEAFVNPRLSIWVGGSPVPWTNGLPNCDLRRLDVVSSNYVSAGLTYTLLNAPAGASIDTNGVISWTPTAGQVPSTNLLTTVVSDSQTPPIRVTNSVVVVVGRLLSVVADNQSRPYGTTNGPLTATLLGLLPGDNITAACTTTATATSPAGTYSLVPVLQDPDGKLTNYTVVVTNGILTVTPAPLTVAALPVTRSYGQPNPVLGVTFYGLVNGEDPNVLGGTLSLSTPAQPTSPVGTYPIVPSGLSATNYTVNYSNSALTITPALLLLTASDQSRAYGATNPVFTGTLTGLLNGDSITASYSTVATTNSPVGSYAIVPSATAPDNKLNNYSLAYSNGTLIVTPSPLLVQADNLSRAYGATNPVFTGTFTGLLNGDDITASYSTLATTNSPVGPYAIVPSVNDPQARLSNYSLSSSNGTLTVLPAALLVTANDASRAYGQTNPLFGATFSGLVNGEDTNVLTGTLLLSSPAQTNSPVGTYPIVPSGLSATNYTLNYSNGTLTVTAFALLVRADDQSRLYGATNPVFTGTVTGLQNGDNVTATYSTLATPNSPRGTYAIVPTLSDPNQRLTNYSVTLSNGTLAVLPATLVVTAKNANRAYGQTNPVFGATFSGFVNGEDTNVLGGSLDLSTPASANSPVGTYAIVPSGLSATNYALNYSNGTLTVTPAPLLVRAEDQTRLYGVTNPVFTGTITGLLESDNITVSYVTSATLNSPAGSYAIVPSLSDPQSRLSNYTLTSNYGFLTVRPVPLLITANNANRAYGQPNPSFSATFSGFVNGEDTNVLGGILDLSTPALANSPVGTYPIMPSGLSATNYTLNYSNGTLTVTTFALLVRADDQSRLYGATNPVFTGTVTGLQESDNITLSYGTIATTNSPVGTYVIVPLLNDPNQRLTNYSVTVSNATLTVTPAPLKAVADTCYRNYGQANALTGTLTGVQNADNITALYTTPADATAPVGSYPITVSLADPKHRLSNYTTNTSGATLFIYPAPLTIQSDNQSRAYGRANPSLTSKLLGLQNYDNITATCWTTADITSPVGTYTISAYLADPDNHIGNYLLDYQDGTLFITPATLTLSLTSSTNPCLPGSSVTFTLTASPAPGTFGVPTGSVQFLVDGTPLGTAAALSNGIARVSTSTLPHGQRAISARYPGDGNFLGNTNSLAPPQLVNTPPRAGLTTLAAQQNRTAFLPATNLLTQCFDPDSDPLRITGAPGPSMHGGAVAFDGTNVVYTPPAGYTGPDLFTFTVSDSFASSATGQVYVTVSSSTTPRPILTAVQRQTDGGMLITGSGIANQIYVLQTSTTLSSWSAVATNSANAQGAISFLDPNAPNYSQRFYRLLVP
jgi:hypothetical protein